MESNPSWTAVIAMHLQNDIATKGGAMGPFFAAQVQSRGIIGVVGTLLTTARAAGAAVVYTRVAWQPGYTDLQANSPLLRMTVRDESLIDGTGNAEIISTLKPEYGLGHHPPTGRQFRRLYNWTSRCAAAESTPSSSVALPPTSPSREPHARHRISATAPSSPPTPAAPPMPPDDASIASLGSSAEISTTTTSRGPDHRAQHRSRHRLTSGISSHVLSPT